MRIGVVCYPTFGGSGVIATEVGQAMAERGHRVHFICYDEPRRMRPADGLSFHGVEVRDYPVFHHPPYVLALASKIVEIATFSGLDLLHVHYAIPHAAAAVMAQDVIRSDGRVPAPRLITTLHGTDITVVGSDPSYLPITRHGLRRSDAVTVPSASLSAETRCRLDLPDLPILTIPNFVDTEVFSPQADLSAPDRLARPLIVHVSNFRAVKRVPDVIEAFARLHAQRPAELLLVGDGPERGAAEAQVRGLGLSAAVRFIGRQEHFAHHLRRAAAFLLPSQSESFGVAALEAMACGIPVVATRVGGLPEVIEHGVSGLLAPVGDVAGLSEALDHLCGKPSRWQAFSEAARRRAVALFSKDPLIDRYEALYREVLSGSA